ncbi:hypothetical protein U1Q18_019013, partial [Sarracenia purpurea var. burkii]
METKANSDQVVLFIDHQTIKTQPLEVESLPKNLTPDEARTATHQAPRRTQTLLRRLSFSKPKSRNVELHHPLLIRTPIFESEELEPLFPNYSTSDDENDDEEEDLEDGGGGGRGEGTAEGEEYGKKRRRRKISCRWRAIAEWVVFMVILTCLVCSLTITSLKKRLTWGLEIWKWCLMMMVIFSGHLVSGWVVGFLVFLIERNFMLRERILYFVYGLRKSFQNCVWLGLVLLAWTWLFDAKIHKSKKLEK